MNDVDLEYQKINLKSISLHSRPELNQSNVDLCSKRIVEDLFLKIELIKHWFILKVMKLY